MYLVVCRGLCGASRVRTFIKYGDERTSGLYYTRVKVTSAYTYEVVVAAYVHPIILTSISAADCVVYYLFMLIFTQKSFNLLPEIHEFQIWYCRDSRECH